MHFREAWNKVYEVEGVKVYDRVLVVSGDDVADDGELFYEAVAQARLQFAWDPEVEVSIVALCHADPEKNADGSPDLSKGYVVAVEWRRHGIPDVTWYKDEHQEKIQAQAANIYQNAMQLNLAPHRWPGMKVTCGPSADGPGCEEKVQLPPAICDRRGDLHFWRTACPNCGKRWTVLVTNSNVRWRQRKALQELRRNGGALSRRTREALGVAIKEVRRHVLPDEETTVIEAPGGTVEVVAPAPSEEDPPPAG